MKIKLSLAARNEELPLFPNCRTIWDMTAAQTEMVVEYYLEQQRHWDEASGRKKPKAKTMAELIQLSRNGKESADVAAN